MPKAVFKIREAKPSDVSLILSLIRELAEFEDLSHQAQATRRGLQDALFGRKPVAEALIAEHEKEAVGFALFFHNFSTFVGKKGLYLEDLYVRPAFRGQGCGQALLRRLVRIALKRDCGRLEWSVLDWNKKAIRFYKALGGKAMDGWTTMRLDRKTMGRLASKKD